MTERMKALSIGAHHWSNSALSLIKSGRVGGRMERKLSFRGGA
jgi:hypothetical protein